MKLNTITRTGGAAASLALLMGLGLTACGSDDSDSGAASSSESTTAAAQETSTGPFGDGCKLIPNNGAGSVDSMSQEPVATAASTNPLLTTLVTAVKEADLVETLDTAEALTVFAPTDDAFKEIPKADLDALLADKEKLTEVLTHHVVAGQLSPDEVAGEHETLAGDMLTVEGSGEEFTVGDEKAAVICGNVPTANATVYVVDTVLMP